jgi:carbon-monoxide dehydrogenase large subunit
MTAAHVGRALRRLEDHKFLIGRATYVGDLQLPRMLHAAFVRSPHAHARIRSIDASAALAAPGVVAVWTGADVNAVTAPLRMAPPIEGLRPTQMDTLPVDKVRFVGDPVACVVATDVYAAEDAAELVVVDYEPLAPVMSVDDALTPGAALVDESLPTNEVCRQRFEYGDLQGAFARADAVVEAAFYQGRQTHLPIEPRGCVADWNPGERTITLHTGNQVPHPLRTALAARMGVPENKARVVSPDVGGGFGQKIPLFREELTACAISRSLGRPIKWIEDRRENLTASLHAREDSVRLRIAVQNDGTILGVDALILADFGAYCFYPANYMARVVGMMIPGPYRFQNYRYELATALTNKTPAAPYRAPMNVCAWVTEGMIEAVARQLGLDSVEVRRRNMVRAEDQPFTSASGQVYEATTPSETTEEALERIDYAALRARQAAARAEGRLIGIGLCTYVEPTAYGSAFYKSAGIAGSGHDVALVRIEPSGAVNVQIGVPTQGQGHATTVAQVVADALGLTPADVAVFSGDTASAPYGMGTRGTRGAVVSAGSALAAANALRDKLVRIAAHVLEVTVEDIELAAGRATVRGTDRGLTVREIAQKAYLAPMELPPGIEPGLEAYRAYDPPPLTFSNATHACVVEIDPETGQLHIERHLIVEDCGTVVNPMIVAGQVHGGTAQGIAGAVYEQVAYSPDGQNLTSSLMDYCVPTAMEIPHFELHHRPNLNPHTPLGIKGSSEGGTMGGSAAVSNAVADALSHLGVVVDRQPLAPEYVRRLIRDSAEAVRAPVSGPTSRTTCP